MRATVPPDSLQSTGGNTARDGRRLVGGRVPAGSGGFRAAVGYRGEEPALPGDSVPTHLRRCCGWMREAGQHGLLVVVAPVGTVTLWPQAQTDVAVRPVRTALKGELWSLTHTAVPPCRPPPFLPSLASFAAGPHVGLYALACVSETCCERGRTTTAGAGGRLGSGVKHFAPGPAKSA